MMTEVMTRVMMSRKSKRKPFMVVPSMEAVVRPSMKASTSAVVTEMKAGISMVKYGVRAWVMSMLPRALRPSPRM